MKILLFFPVILFSYWLNAQNCQHLKQEMFLAPTTSAAENSRSDSFDIQHYTINLNITDFVGKTIGGDCEITCSAKLNGLPYIDFDLQGLTVDSVLINNTLATYSYTDPLLRVNFSAAFPVNTAFSVHVFYHGIPDTDSQWGGFYFQNNYAYNMGVGFAANPHTFGRVWFPCFDNFVERCGYDFYITTNAGKKAHCNGALISETTNPDGSLTRHWSIAEEIPTYLACVAVSDYVTVHQNYSGINGNIPVELVAVAADTNNMKASFVNLHDAMDCFEHWYGPYRWNKIGYSVVPFSGGAMEHATNIAYPKFAVNGTLSYETLYAHELSHHWWGDLATCETEGDMWLNEGWASYSEYLFTEWKYGKAASLSQMIDNHLDVLLKAHIQEGGYRAVSGIPHQYTYGMHVYNKGAVVAHNLRGYLGDSLFKLGLHTVTDEVQFTHQNSSDLRDRLSLATGVDLTDFFNDWVFAGGYNAIEIDSFHTNGNSVTVYTEQKLRGAPHLHNNIPFEFTFYAANGDTVQRKAMLSGHYQTSSFNLPFAAVKIIPNQNNLLLQARSEQVRTITTTGNQNYARARMTLNVLTAPAQPFDLRVEHYYVAPDPMLNNPSNIRLSNSRYWKVYGDFPANFSASVSLPYISNATNSFLDIDLVSVTEDSLLLMYRPDATHEWSVYPYYFKNTVGSSTNGSGAIGITQLLPGEYTFANGDPLLSNEEASQQGSFNDFKIFPNPAFDSVRLEMAEESDVYIFNMQGLLVFSQSKTAPNTDLNISTLAAGNYIIVLKNGLKTSSKKLQKF